MDKSRVWDAARRKLRARMGYNLFETLVTLLLLSLMTGGMAAGVRFASEQYRISMTKSESMVLCSTLCDKIKDKLRNAPGLVRVSDSEQIIEERDGVSIFLYDYGGEIWIGDKAIDETTNSPNLSSNERLIPKSAYSSFKLKAEIRFPAPPETEFPCVRVNLTIRDARGDEAASSQFDVFPLN